MHIATNNEYRQKGANTMAFDKDCPCTADCKKRPNCYGCKEGNQWRLKKQAEAEQRYNNKAFQRYRMEKYAHYVQLNAENAKKPKRILNRKK